MFPNMSAEDNAKAMRLVRGMSQFEEKHAGVEDTDANGQGELRCNTCQEDWPCARIVAMMEMQMLGQLQATVIAKLDQLSGVGGLMEILQKGFGNG